MTSRPATLGTQVECPFCGSEVGAELVTYGGTCPKCFAEIPGDEAPTDPGAEVRAAQDRKDRARGLLPLAVAMGMLLALVTCTGATALAFALWPEPEVAQLLDFDALDIEMPEIVEGTDEMLAKVDPPAPDAAPKPAAPSPNGKAPSDGVASGDLVPRPRPGTAEPDGPMTGLDETATGGRAPGLDGFDVKGPKVRRDANLVLSDPDAIRDMISERMVEFIPGLKVCYDRRLKVMPTLKGSWLLTFQVEKDGTVTNAKATAKDRPDPELEECLAAHIGSRWTFGRISRAQPVSKTVKFTAPGA